MLGIREMRDECVLWVISLNVIAMPRTRRNIMKFNVVRGRSIVIFLFFILFLLSSTYPKRIIGALQRQLWWRGQT